MSVADAPRVEAAWKTDTGRLRSLNEDAVLCFPDRGLFAVIDGVGGEAGGDIGAREAASVLLRRLTRSDGLSTAARIREAIALANNRIFELAQRDPSLLGMSCVLTVAVVEGSRLTLGHIGDTRCYRLRGEPGALPEAQKLTRDHSPVGQMEELGELSESEAMRHPRRNEIYRDVGSTWHRPDDEDFVEIFEDELLPGDALLLCSDGLTDQVPLREIRAIVAEHRGAPVGAVETLVERSNAAGGKDNVSVVLVEAPTAQTSSLPLAAAKTSSELATAAPLSQTAVARRPQSLARVGLALLGLAVLAVGAWVAWKGPAEVRRQVSALLPAGWLALPESELRVGPDERFATIQGALDAARSGQTVTVGPGLYTEQLTLRSGVGLEVLPPRSATLQLPAESPALIAVVAEGIEGASVRGLRIEAPTELETAANGLEIGVQLIDSSVLFEDVSIGGAERAAIDIRGRDRSQLRLLTLSAPAAVLLRIDGNGATTVRESLFERSGGADGAQPMVDIRGNAAPLLLENQFWGPGVAAVLADRERAREIEARNTFEARGAQKPSVVEIRPAPEGSQTP